MSSKYHKLLYFIYLNDEEHPITVAVSSYNTAYNRDQGRSIRTLFTHFDKFDTIEIDPLPYFVGGAMITATDFLDDRFTHADEARADFERNGFFIFEHFLAVQGLAQCRLLLDRMARRRDPKADNDVYFNAHQQEPWLFDLATHPRLLDLIEQHVGPNIVLWGSNIIAKPPGMGQIVAWHQDATEWNIKGRFAPTVWITLDDIAPDNGGMSVLPGWHLKGPLPHNQSRGDNADSKIDPALLPPDIDELKHDYVLKAGRMAIHHEYLPHYSPPNTSDRWRRVILFRYIAAGAQIGDKTYPNYRTGERFPRLNLLVRGEDVAHQGLARTPSE